MSHYNGFNFEEFYEFIIDFFEEDQSPEGKAATNELFNWWNRFVPDSISAPSSLMPPQACISPVRRYPSNLNYISKAVVAHGSTTTAPSTLVSLTLLVFVCVE